MPERPAFAFKSLLNKKTFSIIALMVGARTVAVLAGGMHGGSLVSLDMVGTGDQPLGAHGVGEGSDDSSDDSRNDERRGGSSDGTIRAENLPRPPAMPDLSEFDLDTPEGRTGAYNRLGQYLSALSDSHDVAVGAADEEMRKSQAYKEMQQMYKSLSREATAFYNALDDINVREDKITEYREQLRGTMGDERDRLLDLIDKEHDEIMKDLRTIDNAERSVPVVRLAYQGKWEAYQRALADRQDVVDKLKDETLQKEPDPDKKPPKLKGTVTTPDPHPDTNQDIAERIWRAQDRRVQDVLDALDAIRAKNHGLTDDQQWAYDELKKQLAELRQEINRAERVGGVSDDELTRIRSEEADVDTVLVQADEEIRKGRVPRPRRRGGH